LSWQRKADIGQLRNTIPLALPTAYRATRLLTMWLALTQIKAVPSCRLYLYRNFLKKERTCHADSTNEYVGGGCRDCF
jgi:hypothetical protein